MIFKHNKFEEQKMGETKTEQVGQIVQSSMGVGIDPNVLVFPLNVNELTSN